MDDATTRRRDDTHGSTMAEILPRRSLLIAALAVTGSAVPLAASAASTPEAEAYIARLLKGRNATDRGLELDAPGFSGNGSVIPVSVFAHSPMTAQDHVTAIHLVATDNPWPEVVSFFFTPRSGEARAETRIRLARSQDVVALAERSNGDVSSAVRHVGVGVGGCHGVES